MKDKNEKGLLEKICAEAGCEYLSDLHSGTLIMKRLRLPDKSEYTLEEWTDAVNYIAKCSRRFQTVQEAVDYLRTFLS